MKLKITKPIFFLLIAIGLIVYFSRTKSDFYVHEIPSRVPFHSEWEVSLPESIFSQHYTFLGQGEQCMAFESEDRQYVLKFPYHPPHSSLSKTHKKLMKDASRYVLAFERLKEETGLVYLHLNRTNFLNRKIVVKDRDGLQHIVDLDRVEFIVQKKAQLLYPALARWMAAGQVEKAKEGLSQLLKLFTARFEKEVDDPEQYLEGNFGFLENRAVQIDVGHIRQRGLPVDKAREKEKIGHLLAPFKSQLEADYPELGQHLENEWSTFLNEP